MRLYYLRQRTQSSNYEIAIVDQITGKISTFKSSGTTSKTKAEQIAVQWVCNGMPEKPKYSTKEFCQYLIEFWDYENSPYFTEQEMLGKQPHKQHALDMANFVTRHFTSYFKKIMLKEITEEKINDFLLYLKKEKNLGHSSINHARNVVTVPMKYAVRKQLVARFDKDAVLRAHGKAKTRGTLTRKEVDELFTVQWRDERSRLMTLIAFQTAMRIGEIRALRRCDILKDAISIEHSWSKADGGLKATKTNENRVIPIFPDLQKEISNYIKNRRKLFSLNLTSLLFPGTDLQKPYDERQIHEDFYDALRQIGISEKERRTRNIVFYSSRHYCAKTLAENNVPKQIGMRILGHKTSAMYDHYANHCDVDTINKMREAMSNTLAQNSNTLKAVKTN